MKKKITDFLKTYRKEIVVVGEFGLYIVALTIFGNTMYKIGYIDGGKDTALEFLTSCLKSEAENK